MDFTVEVERSLRVLDGAIAVFCGVGGVEPQSETVWRQADKYRVPRIAFVNKMDRVGSDFEHVVQMMRDRLGARPVPVQIPVKLNDNFQGIVDLVRQVFITYNEETLGATFVEHAMPRDLAEMAAAARRHLIEEAADCDDAVAHKYVEGETITEDDLRAAIRKGTLDGKIVPVFAGAAFKNKGVQRLLDGVVEYLPSPARPAPGDRPSRRHARRGDAASLRRGPLRRAGLQDHDRPLRRQAHLFPRLLGPRQGGDPDLQREPRPRGAAGPDRGHALGQAGGSRRSPDRRHRGGGRPAPRRHRRHALHEGGARSCSRP